MTSAILPKVEQEELEEIRLLKAEEAMSEDAEKKLEELLGKVKSIEKFVRAIIRHPTKPKEEIISGMLHTPTSFPTTLTGLVNKLSDADDSLEEDKDEIVRLTQTAKRVVWLITKAEAQESEESDSLPTRGKRIIEKEINLEETEKRVLIRKLQSLYVVSALLLDIKKLINRVINNLRHASDFYSQGRHIFSIDKSESGKRRAARRIITMENNLEASLGKLELIREALKRCIQLVDAFKNYLSTPKKQSELALRYEEMIHKVYLAAR